MAKGIANVLVVVALFAGACRCTPVGEVESELELAVTHPVILIHGLGGSAKRWDMAGTVRYLEEAGLSFGGVVAADPEGRAEIERPVSWKGGHDFFAVHVSDPFQSLDLWSWEIAKAVELVLEETGAPGVALVGFSAGGLAARKYLVDHPNNHRIERLVTLASPHLGSELALLALGKDWLHQMRDTGGMGGLVAEPIVTVLEFVEEKSGKDLKSALVHQLLPVKYNPYLQELNKSRHPADVDYVCVIVEEELGAGREEIHRELSLLRDGGADSRVLAKASNLLMRALKLGTEGSVEWSLGGDGVVLAESQNLFNVEALQSMGGLDGRSITVRGQHQRAPEGYPELLDALAGDFGFRWAEPFLPEVDPASGLYFYFYFDNILAGLAQVEAFASDKRIPVSQPRIFSYEGESYARSTVGPVPADVSQLEVRVQPAAGDPTYSKQIILGTGATGFAEMVAEPLPSDRVVIRFRSVAGISGRKSSGGSWDLPIPRAESARPDLRIELEVDGESRGLTEVLHDVPENVMVEEELVLNFWPRESRAVLRLWDHDGASSEKLGEVVWNPGMLPIGPATVQTATGLTVELETEWEERPRMKRDRESFFLKAPRRR